jgi:uncharacterized repeat protein (TIGR01451 family)
MSKQIAIILAFATAGLFLVHPVFADNQCNDQYGNTVPCQPTNLNINKMVQDPISGKYVENITTPEFSQGNNVNFKLTVTNNSGETFTNVSVTDGVPTNLLIDDATTNLNSGVKIDVSSDKKNLTVHIDNLTVNESVDIYVFTHLVGAYPAGDSFCQDNWAKVTASARPNGDTNFARFCVANNASGAKTLPTAGVEDLLYIIPSVLTGIGGLALLRKNK